MNLHIDDAELTRLLADLESDRVERKERLAGDAPAKIREAICAFANDLPGRGLPGVVVVGARDDGTPANIHVTDELLCTLADMRSDGNILPIPTMIVQKRIIGGAELAVVTVAPASAPPVAYKGRIMVRVGPRRGIASRQEEGILNERRHTRDLPFDLQPIPTASVADLDRRSFEEEYLPGVVARDVIAANDRTYEERLAAARMIVSVREPVPTLVGVLVLSARARDFVPGAYVQFLRMSGVDLAAPIADAEDISGPLAQIVRRLDEKIRAHVRMAVDLTSGPTEMRSPDYPLPATEQIARNALMHRTYEATNAPIRVTWYDDRIEILSPGGPYGIVTPETFGQPGVTDYRNPTLAEAMKAMGFVQRFGVGLAIARRAVEAAGNPPIEWTINERQILATLRPRPPRAA